MVRFKGAPYPDGPPQCTGPYKDVENMYQVNSTDVTCSTVNYHDNEDIATPIISSIYSSCSELQKNVQYNVTST